MSRHEMKLLTTLLIMLSNCFWAVTAESQSVFGSSNGSIRHERSKVRHSNEKGQQQQQQQQQQQHLIWSVRAAGHNVSSGDGVDLPSAHKDTARAAGNVTRAVNSLSLENAVDRFVATERETATRLSYRTQLAPAPAPPPSPSSSSSPVPLSLPLLSPSLGATTATPTPLSPVTHKIRKLHKKKLVESIRNSVDKGRLSKSHRSLVQAEQLQGRPTDINEPERADGDDYHGADQDDGDDDDDDTDDDENGDDENSDELGAVLQLADELDDLQSYQRDAEYVASSPPTSGTGGLTAVAAQPEDDAYVVLPPKSKNHSRLLQSPPDSEEDLAEMDYSSVQSSSTAATIDHDGDDVGGAGPYANLLEKNDTESVFSANLGRDDMDQEVVVTEPAGDLDWMAEAQSQELHQLASTSMGGIRSDRQQAFDVEEINFDESGLDSANEPIMDDAFMDNSYLSGFPMSGPGGGSGDGVARSSASNDEGADETSRFLESVVDAANADESYDWDEISRNNRRNLMRGRDVVTRFLQIVETQHSLGANCEAGTSLNLGEGVVDRYAQDRFRVEADVAVNRANMLTRIFKMTSRAAQADVNLLHASVLSMVEFDDDIFAAGNCFDWNEHPAQPGLFCPFAYRLPPPHLGAILAKDLATEYHYLGNTSEWFFQARKNAEKVIARNEQYLKAFHLYSNKTEERIEDDTLAVKYEDGRWSKPYYDCGGGNIWMLTYTVPFFGYENGTYHFKGTSGIDIDLRRVDIDQCPQRSTPAGTMQPLNIFAGTDKCKQRTTMCEALKGLGFRRGSYKCVCRKGYYFPDTTTMQKFFNGSLLEEEYEKLMLGKNSSYNNTNEFECLPCAEGCESCVDGSPCIATLNWPMRTSILVLACIVIGLLPPAAWFTFRYQQVKVVRAASPALLRVIALGAFFIYCTNIVMYPNPSLYTCTARIWLREIGFSLTYGALMLKTWRISVIFRVRSAKAVKITDAALLKRLGCICGAIGTCLLVRTLVSPPDVVVGRTADDLKAFLCKTDWWDYTFTSMEVVFLAWGVRLCIMVRKAPSEFNESRFISMAIYNEFLLTCFLNVSMLFLQSPANPDLLYIIFFCHTQLTVTLLLGLIFGSKVYIVLRSGKSHQESIGMAAKAAGAKFNFRPQVRTFANPSSMTTSSVPAVATTSAEAKLSDQEALEEIRQLSVQLQRIQEMAPPKGVAVMTISSLLDGLRTPGSMMMVAATQTAQATTSGHQLTVSGQPAGSLPLLSLNNEIQRYGQLQVPQSNNNVGGIPTKSMLNVSATLVMEATPPSEDAPRRRHEEKAVNTELIGNDFHTEATAALQGRHLICERCLRVSKEHYDAANHPASPPPSAQPESRTRPRTGTGTRPRPQPQLTTCQLLGSPQPGGSLSFEHIKLDCMCSASEDAEDGVRTSRARRIKMRSAATNTPPADRRRRHYATRARSSFSLSCEVAGGSGSGGGGGGGEGGSVSYRICDNCKSKYSNSLLSEATRRCSKQAADGKGGKGRQQRNNSSQTGAQKPLSNDDSVFYATTDSDTDFNKNDDDDDKNGDDADADDDHHHEGGERRCSACLSRSRSESCCSGAREHKSSAGVEGDVTASAAELDSSKKSQTATGCCSTIAKTNENNGGSGSGSGSGGRAKRPDKLLLNLNDRSKYTKEVSV